MARRGSLLPVLAAALLAACGAAVEAAPGPTSVADEEPCPSHWVHVPALLDDVDSPASRATLDRLSASADPSVIQRIRVEVMPLCRPFDLPSLDALGRAVAEAIAARGFPAERIDRVVYSDGGRCGLCPCAVETAPKRAAKCTETCTPPGPPPGALRVEFSLRVEDCRAD
ncbi:MAG: hypothetical protein R3B82_15800 [Sandaracinaceae bacterium]